VVVGPTSEVAFDTEEGVIGKLMNELGVPPVPVAPVKAVELELTGYGADKAEDVMTPLVRIDELPVGPTTTVVLDVGNGAEDIAELVEGNTPLTSLVEDGRPVIENVSLYDVGYGIEVDETGAPPAVDEMLPVPVGPPTDVEFETGYGADEELVSPPLSRLVEGGRYPEPVGRTEEVVLEEMGYGTDEVDVNPPLTRLVGIPGVVELDGMEYGGRDDELERVVIPVDKGMLEEPTEVERAVEL
jgi:hypothetical protein